MPVTEIRGDTLLKRLLDGCIQCSEEFHRHLDEICDGRGRLTDAQVEAVLAYLLDLHRNHE